MEIRSRCIALRTVRYKDNKSIVTCLVREAGRMAFIVPDGKSREAVRRRAIMMPGSEFECVIDFRENRSLHSMKDIRPRRALIVDNPAKMPVLFFVCDLLNSLLRDAQKDQLLYDYIDSTIDSMLSSRSVGNSTMAFMIGLMRFMGVMPDLGTWRRGRVLDMRSGVFVDSPPLNSRWLSVEESAVAARLLRINMSNMRFFRFTRQQRRQVLDLLVDYYSMHFGTTASLKSLDVVRTLFD